MIEVLATDKMNWKIGPFHPALGGPITMSLGLDGEIITSARCETGFLHRGLEKAMELQQWFGVVSYADRIDPEQGVFFELAICLAVEEIAGLEVPGRAERVRVILCELTRIGVHLGYVLKISRALGLETVVHYALRDREKISDLFELIAGARANLNYFRFGGVAADITDGFIERVIEVCEVLRVRVKEYQDLLVFHQVFMKRAVFAGVLNQSIATKLGVTGPNARAAGIQDDLRKSDPYCGYEKFEFKVPVGAGEFGTIGSVHERVLIRMREISQSIDIIMQATENVPAGDFSSVKNHFENKIPEGQAFSRVESARGFIGAHIISDGGNTPYRVQIRSGSKASLQAVPKILPGSYLGDMALVLTSLDYSVAELDK